MRLPIVRIYALFAFLPLLVVGCGDSSEGSTPPEEAEIAGPGGADPELPIPDSYKPVPESRVLVECGVDLGLGPEDGVFVDFADKEQSWHALWDQDALILTVRYACGDECSQEYVLRIEDALAACPEHVGVRKTLQDRGSPDGKPVVSEVRDGMLSLQDWDVQQDGPLLVSGRVEAEVAFTFYLDTRGE